MSAVRKLILKLKPGTVLKISLVALSLSATNAEHGV
jgi:hypothetical protein